MTASPQPAVLDALLRRRSVSAQQLSEPGPDNAQLEQILTAAARVPDHKKLVPWRFILIEGAARARLGEGLAEILAREAPAEATPDRIAIERGRFTRAPVVVAVVSRVVESPAAPEWEQVLSAGACCQNLCIAANALGFATNWITEWCGYSKGVASLLGLAAHERIAGFVHIGTPKIVPPDRDRPRLADITTRWQG
jgi:nitroreductase